MGSIDYCQPDDRELYELLTGYLKGNPTPPPSPDVEPQGLAGQQQPNKGRKKATKASAKKESPTPYDKSPRNSVKRSINEGMTWFVEKGAVKAAPRRMQCAEDAGNHGYGYLFKIDLDSDDCEYTVLEGTYKKHTHRFVVGCKGDNNYELVMVDEGYPISVFDTPTAAATHCLKLVQQRLGKVNSSRYSGFGFLRLRSFTTPSGISGTNMTLNDVREQICKLEGTPQYPVRDPAQLKSYPREEARAIKIEGAPMPVAVPPCDEAMRYYAAYLDPPADLMDQEPCTPPLEPNEPAFLLCENKLIEIRNGELKRCTPAMVYTEQDLDFTEEDMELLRSLVDDIKQEVQVTDTTTPLSPDWSKVTRGIHDMRI